MKPVPTLYLDTSVIGGYFDAEWMKGTRELWRLMELGCARFVTSSVTVDEIALARDHVRDLFAVHFDISDILPLSDEAKALADIYIRHGVLPQNCLNDARQVAVCTLARIELLVSWNFKHLVNAERKKGFHAINLLQGQPHVSIVTPWEVIYDIS